ncbi:MAG TPA: sigma-70 family RNA polymerase sigma factor [Polyangiaceae bacterium]
MRAVPLNASASEPTGADAPLPPTSGAEPGKRDQSCGSANGKVELAPLELGQLYDEHFPLVWRTLRRFGLDESFLDDAAQDVFMVALRRHKEFRGQSSYRTWLFGIAVNVAREYRRKDRRSVPLPESFVHEPAVASSPLDHVTQQEALQFLERFLVQLDDSRRAVFVMIELEQVPAPEVARALGVNLNTVYSRLRSARQAFVAALNKQTAGAPR